MTEEQEVVVSQERVVYRELLQRIEALEVGAVFKATRSEVLKMHDEFREKMQALEDSESKQQTMHHTSENVQVTDELKSLRAENAELKKKNTKLEYRVRHVVSELAKMFDQLYGNRNETNTDCHEPVSA